MLLIKYIFTKVYVCGSSFPDGDSYPGKAWINAYIAAFLYCVPIVVCIARSLHQFASILGLGPSVRSLLTGFERGEWFAWLVIGVITVFLEVVIVGWGSRSRRVAEKMARDYCLGPKEIWPPAIFSMAIVYLTAVCLIYSDPLFDLIMIALLYVVAGFAVKRRLLN